MTVASPSDVYYDPFDPGIDADPYPVYRRLREEAPLYYNERHDFFAVSRADDVERVLTDHKTFISGRGSILDFIRANLEMPPSMFIFQDPPVHTRYRKVLHGVFTPRRVAELEDKVRDFCARSLDAVVGSGKFDFMADLGAQVPMRTIGMLLGIPETDQDTHRQWTDASLRAEPGEHLKPQEGFADGSNYAEYIDWRAEHPSDDLMTDLLNAQLEEEDGSFRRLTREEVLTYTTLLSSAGAETTGHLIGWTGKTLADHPAQRRQLVEDPSLIPRAIEEVLRLETPAHQFARYVTTDVDFYGQTVPEGSVMLYLIGSANHDERRFPDGDRFDIHRENVKHLSFSLGAHYCLGSALARLEGRIALEEILKRFPVWEIDVDNARMASSPALRGWDSLPAFI
ncbi:cytochrome P450 [Mycolicibacterium holsaticum]|uniref:cytochrome P450 n=1 Tax=Mycolicibacterium holsaticum TaxID=152142 RepID=UPI001C7CABFE|nr:cytochrome P450 [Mycolicibacterium holsaticum]MDA4106797.1 cytochrome P450 [Mycolicibacterium holsaticum DSM 44478 = JCM 12374]QZA14081.1 cytochrome P450 [Mycolicibacterium holsaticum DSM 44478 = JCM 12374]UNC08462.1 cytochrome P450 [Mycolicibacterium holsaticum DSM 44478 = JCM 12374]